MPNSANQLQRLQGADLLPGGGVRYRIWAPEIRNVEVLLYDETGDEIIRTVAAETETGGIHVATDSRGKAGDRYRFRLNGDGIFPDPFSRWQPDGVFGPSMVIDPRAYSWKIENWEKIPLRDAVIYELHLGTFSPEGTFRGAIAKLDHLVSLGANVIEIMPVAAFPGQRGWGYDGVMPFAPESSYGHPDDFRALIDAAHERGLNVLLDVVYNHFGPDGNFLSCFSPHYFNPEKKTPWGDAINFSGEDASYVRALFLSNVAYWMDEFRVDGFRLDATHEILDDSTPHILTELAQAIHARGGIVVAEDDRNLADLAVPVDRGGYGLDGLWADDFHHTVRVALIPERQSYFLNFTGEPEELVETLHNGWYYCGQTAPALKAKRGTPTGNLRIDQFIHCISNHDQVGNRAFGERLNHLVSPEAYRAASTLLCLTPGVPLLFMGQEWAASNPFLYFTDHHDELGKLVTEGRRREFRDFFKTIHESRSTEEIPDPQSEETFHRSKLNWQEIDGGQHAQTLELYRRLLELRHANPDIRRRTRENVSVRLLGNGIVGLRFQETKHSGLLLLIDLAGGHSWDFAKDDCPPLPSGWTWSPILSSNEKQFGGDRESLDFRPGQPISFAKPEVLLFRPVNES